VIAAILRAQLLTMRPGAGRGAAIGLIASLVWYGMWCFVSAVAYLGAFQATPAELERFLPAAFLGVCAYWQLVPVITVSMGSGLDLRKLLVYPVPHGQLFFVEILLRVIAGAEMIMVLAAGSFGLVQNPHTGGPHVVPGLALAVLLIVLFNVLLASGMRSLLERLLTNRKLRELLGLIFLSLYVVPRLLVYAGVRRQAFDRPLYLIGLVALPWAAAAHVAFPFGPSDARWMALLFLCGWTLLAGWFGRAQFERNLRYDALAAQATPISDAPSRGQAFRERLYRLPSLFLPDPMAAMVEKELRSLARSSRFRMVFIMGFTFGLAVWVPTMVTRGASGRSVPEYFLVVVCVYALTLLGQVSFWNCFGFDRSAAAIYFIAPQPILAAIAGKNIASLIFVYLEVAILSVVSMAFRLASGWGNVAETFVVVGICSLYMLAIGNLSSVHYPRGLSPERVSQGGSSSRFHGMIFLLYPFTLVPVFLAYVARWALRSQLAFVLVLAIAAIIGGVVYWIAMESAVHAAGRRREAILQELSKTAGPVARD
jgi:ABC-2 type transport system permease protein